MKTSVRSINTPAVANELTKLAKAGTFSFADFAEMEKRRQNGPNATIADIVEFNSKISKVSLSAFLWLKRPS